jgi:membrane protease YdiL (CAAX protease family)
MDNNQSKRSIILFVALAVGGSLLYYGLFFLHGRGFLAFDPSSDLMGAVRGYGPAFAAIVTAAVIYGRGGLKELWMRVKMWRIHPWLLALAIFGPMLGSLVLVLIIYFAGVDLVPNPGSVPLPKLILVFFFFAIVDGPVGEEIGWRGFLLPRLLENYGAIFASTFIGIVWFAWHLPLYIATDKFDITLFFFLSYLLNNVAFSFLHTWFFLRSGGSALLAIILHTAGNYSVFLAVTLFPSIEQSPITQPVYLGILVFAAILAGVSIWRNPAYRLQKAV